MRIETEKLEKKKVAASRFVLAPSAKCEMKKKDQKLVVRKRRGCFFCAWRIVLLVSWLRLGETESNSSLFCYCSFVNGQMKKMRTWTDKFCFVFFFFLFSFFFFLFSFFFFLCAVSCLRLLPSASWKRKTPKKKILFALRASCQRLLLSAIWKRKTEKIFLFALRASCPRLLPNANRNRKAGKKKSCRFALRARAFCQMWNEKKGSKISGSKKKRVFFLRLAHCAACVVTASRWNRIE